MKLLLLRHGRTQANEQHLYCGKTDLPLSPKGREELKAYRTAGIYPDPADMQVFTSGMQRTNETLDLIYGLEPDAYIPELAEMDFGKYEMHSYDELKEDSEYIRWILDEEGSVSTPGGESRKEFAARIQKAADSLNGDSLIVTHGGVIAFLMEYLFPEEEKNFYDRQPSCGCGYMIDTDTHTYTAIRLNEK